MLFLGWTVSYPNDGSIIISQMSLVTKTISNEGTAAMNDRQTPYTYGADLRPHMEHDIPLLSTTQDLVNFSALCDTYAIAKA